MRTLTCRISLSMSRNDRRADASILNESRGGERLVHRQQTLADAPCCFERDGQSPLGPLPTDALKIPEFTRGGVHGPLFVHGLSSHHCNFNRRRTVGMPSLACAGSVLVDNFDVEPKREDTIQETVTVNG